MSFYRLSTTIVHPEAIIDFRQAEKAFSFFIMDKGTGEWLQKSNFSATAQHGYTQSNIGTTDYLSASIGVPVFSSRFVEKAGGYFCDELHFFKLAVYCKNKSYPFYAAKTRKYISNIVNKEQSTYIEIEGARILDKTCYNENVPTKFFIARDAEFVTELVVSEEFRRFSEKMGFSIKFISV
jgi:hypothetical protein